MMLPNNWTIWECKELKGSNRCARRLSKQNLRLRANPRTPGTSPDTGIDLTPATKAIRNWFHFETTRKVNEGGLKETKRWKREGKSTPVLFQQAFRG